VSRVVASGLAWKTSRSSRFPALQVGGIVAGRVAVLLFLAVPVDR
jgi:hypothetical protein